MQIPPATSSVGAPFDAALLHTDALSRGIPTKCAERLAVVLDEHNAIDVYAKRFLVRFPSAIGSQARGRRLAAISLPRWLIDWINAMPVSLEDMNYLRLQRIPICGRCAAIDRLPRGKINEQPSTGLIQRKTE